MYECPKCAARLKTWHVLSAAPLHPRTCSACGNAYFGGGLPMAMVSLCSSAALAVLILSIGGSATLLCLALALGVSVGAWFLVRSSPKPKEQRWAEIFKTFLPVGMLWVAFQLAPPLMLSVASLLRQ